MSRNLVGMSLTVCVANICRGEIDEGDIRKIVTRTKVEDPRQLLTGIYDLRRSDWKGLENAEEVFLRLWEEGRIEQPHMGDGPPPSHSLIGGAWLDVEQGQQFYIDEQGERQYARQLSERAAAILEQVRQEGAEIPAPQLNALKFNETVKGHRRDE